MVGVHVLIVGHIAHWAIAGRSMAPAVLSESMKTLEGGQINPGFLLFAAAALVTLVAGRFLCGWGCHMGGLQTFCGWLLKKAKLKPRPFRSRWLGYVPIALAVYMFAWPSLRRDIIIPVLMRVWPQALAHFGPYQPFPGWTTRLETTDFWDGLPGVWVAIPFLLICGGATVFFLGSRGFCHYGCPYGGVFAPLEQLAPVRVVLDPDACTMCGKCTAACEMGVRVMEETQAFGSVVNRDCVRSMDCIEACPTGALSLGLTRPAVFKKRRGDLRIRRNYDLSAGGEAAVLGLFAVGFLGTRSIYNVVPMFMAVGIGLCGAFLGWKLWRTLRDRDARFAKFQLRRAGRWRPAGFVFAAGAATVLTLLVHSAALKAMVWSAGQIENLVTVPREAVFAGGQQVPAEQRAIAARALRLYRLAAPISEGGVGLASWPVVRVRAAWLAMVCGDFAYAEAQIRAMLRDYPEDGLASDLARIVFRTRGAAAAEAELRALVGAHPGYGSCRDMLMGLYVSAGRAEDAEAMLTGILAARPRDAMARARLGALHLNLGRSSEALEELRRAAKDDPASVEIAHEHAMALTVSGSVEPALSELERAAGLDARHAPALLQEAAEIAAAHGLPRAADRLQRMLESARKHPKLR